MSDLSRRDAVIAVAASALAATVASSEVEAQEPKTQERPQAPSFTEAQVNTYERVARTIGNAMDGAWKQIMRDLATGNTEGIRGFLDDGRPPGDDLAVFFSMLNQSAFNLDFLPKAKKTAKGQVQASEAITPTVTDARAKADRAAFVGGEVHVGGSIHF